MDDGRQTDSLIPSAGDGRDTADGIWSAPAHAERLALVDELVALRARMVAHGLEVVFLVNQLHPAELEALASHHRTPLRPNADVGPARPRWTMVPRLPAPGTRVLLSEALEPSPAQPPAVEAPGEAAAPPAPASRPDDAPPVHAARGGCACAALPPRMSAAELLAAADCPDTSPGEAERMRRLAGRIDPRCLTFDAAFATAR